MKKISVIAEQFNKKIKKIKKKPLVIAIILIFTFFSFVIINFNETSDFLKNINPFFKNSSKFKDISEIHIGMGKSYIDSILGNPKSERQITDKYLYCYYDLKEYAITTYYTNNITLDCYIFVLKDSNAEIPISFFYGSNYTLGTVKLGKMNFTEILSMCTDISAPIRLSASPNPEPLRFYNELYSVGVTYAGFSRFFIGMTSNGTGNELSEYANECFNRGNTALDPSYNMILWLAYKKEEDDYDEENYDDFYTDFHGFDWELRKKRQLEWFSSDFYRKQIKDFLSREEIINFHNNTKPNYFGIMSPNLDYELMQYIIETPVGYY